MKSIGLAIPRIPGYTYTMNTKCRYRRRLRLRAALTRVMEVLAANVGDGISPDPKTAVMAEKVIEKLTYFVDYVDRNLSMPDEDLLLESFTKHIGRRKKETYARYRRRIKKKPRQASDA